MAELKCIFSYIKTDPPEFLKLFGAGITHKKPTLRESLPLPAVGHLNLPPTAIAAKIFSFPVHLKPHHAPPVVSVRQSNPLPLLFRAKPTDHAAVIHHRMQGITTGPRPWLTNKLISQPE